MTKTMSRTETVFDFANILIYLNQVHSKHKNVCFTKFAGVASVFVDLQDFLVANKRYILKDSVCAVQMNYL